MWECPECHRVFKRTNQSHYCGEPPKTVEEYIKKQPEELQTYLTNLQSIINDSIPEATETISWSMPTWKKKGNIIHFSTGKNHISIHAGSEAVSHFEEALKGFEVAKGVIHLDPKKPLPEELIADLSKWCYEQDQKRKK